MRPNEPTEIAIDHRLLTSLRLRLLGRDLFNLQET
jgi:hypothetical protein